MLLDQIKADLVSAQKNREQEKIDTLRFLLGEVQNYRISRTTNGKEYELKDEDVSLVLAKQVKTHKESIEMFEKGGRKDLVEKEQAQLVILQSYLPEQMGEEEIRNKIQEIVISHKGEDFGTMMKLGMAELKGKADGALVSKILREMIQ